MKPILFTLGTLTLAASVLASSGAGAAVARKPARAASLTAKAAARAKKPAAKPAGKPGAPKVDPNAGTLKAPYDEFSMGLLTWREFRPVQVEGKKGIGFAPPGSYWLTGWEVRKKDAAGRVWRAQGGPQGQPQTAVHLRRGETTEVQPATPLRADMAVEQAGEEFAFVLQFYGTAGDRCHRILVDGRTPPGPKLKITDAEGTLIGTVDFKFGCSFLCRKSWKAPEDAKWPLTGTLEMDFGALTVTHEPIPLKREESESHSHASH